MTADQFATDAKAWIEASFSVVDLLIAKLGLIALALGSLYGKLVSDRNLRALHERLDRQREAINRMHGAPSTEHLDAAFAAPIPPAE